MRCVSCAVAVARRGGVGSILAPRGDQRLCRGQQRVHVEAEKRSDGWGWPLGGGTPAGWDVTRRRREDSTGLQPGLKPDGRFGGVGVGGMGRHRSVTFAKGILGTPVLHGAHRRGKERRNEAAIDTAWRGGERTDGPIATPETSGGEF